MRQRALPIRLVTVGKHRDPAVEKVVLDYGQKVRRYCSFEEVQVRPNPKNTRQASQPASCCFHPLLFGVSIASDIPILTQAGCITLRSDVATQVAAEGDQVLRGISSKDWVGDLPEPETCLSRS